MNIWSVCFGLFVLLQSVVCSLNVLGIFSMCENYPELQNNFTKQGAIYNYAVTTFYDYSPNLDYTGIDVCFNETVLLNFLIDEVLTNTSYFEIGNDSAPFRHIKVDTIILHVPLHMFKITQDILSTTDIIIVKFTRDIILPTTYADRLGFDVISNLMKIEKLIREYWNEIILIDLQFSKASVCMEKIISFLKEERNICYKVLRIDPSDYGHLKQLDALISNEKNDRLVTFFFETKSEEFHIPSSFLDYNKSIIIGSVDVLVKNESLPRNIVRAPFVNVFRLLSQYSFLEQVEPSLTLDPDYQKFKFEINSLVAYFFFALDYIKRPLSMSQQEYRAILKSNLASTKESDFLGFEPINENRTKESLTNNCTDIVCEPGFRKVFGVVTSSLWDEEVGYSCQRCPEDKFKSTYGDGPCQSCQTFFIPNANRTKCINPSKLVYLEPNRRIGTIIIALCVLGAFLPVFTIFIFLKNRKSPIVRLSDSTFSLLHLCVLATTSIVLPLLYFDEPTEVKCVARLGIIVLFYNNSVSFILIKSMKLLNAFSSGVRTTGRDVQRTLMQQASIIVINTFLGLSILAILLYRKLPEVLSTLNIEQKQQIFYCDNNLHFSVLIAYTICLHLACSYRAYQYRNLPGYLSEATSIAIGSFAVTISFTVMYPISHFQKNQLDVSVVQILFVAGNNLLIYLFMYGYKMYLIIFQPRKNTKVYFRRLQMQAAKERSHLAVSFKFVDTSPRHIHA